MNLLKNLFGSSQTSAVQTVDAATVKERLAGKPAPFVLDVRQPDEFRSGHIKGAKLIPLDQLSGRLDELPRDREILCVCRSGARSSVAARQLAGAGFTVMNLRGGMMSWQMAGYPVSKGK